MSNQRSALLKVLFVLMSTICCGFFAMQMSPLFLPKNPGLAGGAMVLMYGVFGLLFGLILSLFLMNRLGDKTFKILTGVLSILGVVGLIWLFIKISESNKKMAAQRAESEEFYRTHKPTAMAEPIPEVGSDAMMEKEFGLGMASPHFGELKDLLFYNNPTHSDQVTVTDKVTFKSMDYGPEIATAPPYLVPHHLKMDYQIFYFLVKSQTKDHYQIVVNKTNGQTAWVRKADVTFKPWSDFLLNVFSVEPLNWNDNLIRIKPMSHASPIDGINQDNILQPIQIQDEWIQVNILDQQMKSTGKGWLRWRSDSALLIEYSLLS